MTILSLIRYELHIILVDGENRPDVGDGTNNEYIGKAIGPDKCYASCAQREEARRKSDERFPLAPGSWDNVGLSS